jgi:co-chaperonin GroES (HSP10)
MKTTVLGNRIIVEKEEGYKPTAGGLLLKTDSVWNKFAIGEVKLAGEGVYDQAGYFRENKVKAGDIILYDQSARKQISIEGKEYFHIFEGDVVAIVDPLDEN